MADVARDNDPAETWEWRQAPDSVLAFEGPERAGHHVVGGAGQSAG